MRETRQAIANEADNMDSKWMKNVLSNLVKENASNLMNKREEHGWTTSGPWGMLSQDQQAAWQKRLGKVGKGSKESNRSSKSKRSKESVQSSVDIDFNPDKMPPTPPSLNEPEDEEGAEVWDPAAKSESESEDEVEEVQEAPIITPGSKKKMVSISEESVLEDKPKEVAVVRHKLMGGFAKFADKTRWRRTVESFDDAVDNEKLWAGYLRHFTTADLNYFSDCFMKRGGRRGHIGVEDACLTAREYMCLRWNAGSANLLVLEDVEEINKKIDCVKGIYDFDRLVRFIYNFQQVALSKDEYHGFKSGEVKFLKDMFYEFVESGVRPDQLFRLMGALGHNVNYTDEQRLQTLFRTLKMQDHVGKNGCIPFTGFLYFVQRVNQQDDQAYRQDEQEKVIKSGFNDKEIEEFRTLFDRFVDTPNGELSLAAIKLMFMHLMMPLKREQLKEVARIIEEGDQNGNGTIDFGEFVTLLRELWRRDFCDLKTLSQKLASSSTTATRRMSAQDLKESVNDGVGKGSGSMRRRSSVELAMISSNAPLD